MENQTQQNVVSRGLLPIYYSSTSGMSKDYANRFQSKAEEIGFVSPVMNVGDIQFEEFLQYQGPAVFFLSTYGNGDSPQDGECFLKQVEAMKKTDQLKNLGFIILAFGNSSFQHFCGFGRKVTQAFINNGATMLVQTKKCDAYRQAESAPQVYQKWSQAVINTLTLKYPLKNFPISNLTGGFQAQIKPILQNQQHNWQNEYQLTKNSESVKPNLSKQFLTYANSYKTQVIHIKQMRNITNDNKDENRSTLQVRIKTPQGMKLWPGCNINIYPENVLIEDENQRSQIIEFKSKSKSMKIPYPPMVLSELKKLLNFKQKPSNKLIKNAILLSSKTGEVIQKYKRIIAQNKIEEQYKNGMTCQTLITQLKPKYQFYAQLGINLPRTYTLASWKNNKQYFDLCISTVKNGLTSTFLKSNPKYLRINSFESTFTVPQNKPLIMIANGSGIAPFRSIVQYVAQQKQQNRTPLKLFYGIQNQQIDYYFKQCFEHYQKQGIVQIYLAQSRRDPSTKVYVQSLVELQKQSIREHLFKKQGQIYVCGGKQMSKSVNAALFKSITLECKIPYKSFGIMNGFKSKKVIVEEVFG